jgi:hypothetical protein
LQVSSALGLFCTGLGVNPGFLCNRRNRRRVAGHLARNICNLLGHGYRLLAKLFLRRRIRGLAGLRTERLLLARQLRELIV